MNEISRLDDYDKVISDSQYSVIMFHSDLCGDCHYANHFMPHIEKLYNAINFYAIKRETMPKLALELNIIGVPSFLVYKDKQLVNSWIDKERKHFAEVLKFIEETINEGK